MKTHTLSPADQVAQALDERSYRVLARYDVLQMLPLMTATLDVDLRDTAHPLLRACTIYTNGHDVLLLHTWTDGGCELYRPISEQRELHTMIDAIPSPEKE